MTARHAARTPRPRTYVLASVIGFTLGMATAASVVWS